jgi:hypothetical protein
VPYKGAAQAAMRRNGMRIVASKSNTLRDIHSVQSMFHLRQEGFNELLRFKIFRDVCEFHDL